VQARWPLVRSGPHTQVRHARRARYEGGYRPTILPRGLTKLPLSGVRCPASAAFAPGAHGNLATESLVSHLHRNGVSTGIDLDALDHAREVVQAELAAAAAVECR
jgi:hypothetical protein